MFLEMICVKIYTIGFTKKTLEEFIRRLKKNRIQLIVDVRLNTSSQLSGFAKTPDLEFILRQFGIKYISLKNLAPDKEMLKKYREDKNWEEYENDFKLLMDKRNAKKILEELDLDNVISCFLCSEDKPNYCHRRLVAEMMGNKFEIVHL